MNVRAKTGGSRTRKKSLPLRNTTTKTSAHAVMIKSINQNVVSGSLSIDNCCPRFPDIRF